MPGQAPVDKATGGKAIAAEAGCAIGACQACSGACALLHIFCGQNCEEAPCANARALILKRKILLHEFSAWRFPALFPFQPHYTTVRFPQHLRPRTREYA